MQHIFVTGIDTNAGKTIVSAIVTEALQSDYWKPVQSGYTEGTDTDTVKQLVSNPFTTFHPSVYNLRLAMSPHVAAEREGVTIDPNSIVVPETNRHLVIEGAGGLMVPLNNHYLVIDLIAQLKAPVILVSRNYLGSINHTLLSAMALHQRQIPVLGIVFNGDEMEGTEDIILQHTGYPV
ncbi:MAG: dethiobiotin synthase, partial [Chitinophagia bacterium]|nr:dethiobiotin synthase [Chitinophagia bacterium]